MKQTLAKLKGEIDCSAVIVGGFNTIPAIMDRLSKQKISKNIEGLNNAVNQLALTDIYRILNSSGVHSLLQCTCSVRQDGQYLRTQYVLKDLKSCKVSSLTTEE